MAPNVLIIDAAYIDRVAAAFRQHFGAELKRELPKADLAQWLVCMALDAELVGVEEEAKASPTEANGEAEAAEADVQCIFIHDRETKVMQHVTPGNFSQEIDGKAFTEPGLGEFAMACCPVERVTTLEELCEESLQAVLDDKKVRRVAVVYDFDGTSPESTFLTKRITKLCAKHGKDADEKAPKDVTLFTMKALEGEGFAQQVLGYSLIAALGIGGDELQ